MTNSRRSRKWIITCGSLVIVTAFAGFGIFVIAKTATDVALIIGAWAASDTTIIGIYNASNVVEKRSTP